MRTPAQLHADLADVNVQEVSRRSGVNAKTLYRIRQDPEYTTNARTAESVSKALDAIAARRKPKPRTRSPEESEEAKA